MLDATGYLIIRGALSSSEVEEGRAVSWLRCLRPACLIECPADRAADPVRAQGCDSYVAAAEASRVGGPPLPAGFDGNGASGALGSTYPNGNFWSTSLERLLFHRTTWPIVLELTGGKPCFHGGVTLYDDFSRGNAHSMGGFLHCKRDAQKRNPDAFDPSDPAGIIPFQHSKYSNKCEIFPDPLEFGNQDMLSRCTAALARMAPWRATTSSFSRAYFRGIYCGFRLK